MTKGRVEARFLESSTGPIFVLLRTPPKARRCVLFIPPFGEEMNKCRRQVTDTAERLTNAGFATLLVDLFGTGDSAGDFADTSWQAWSSNIGTAVSWARTKGVFVDAFVATRLGCILAAQFLVHAAEQVQASVFWQPVVQGRQFISQFLRLRVAASMMEGNKRESVESLRDALTKGESIEVAGYRLPPALWRDIEALDLLSSLSPAIGELAVFEISSLRDSPVSPATAHLLTEAAKHGIGATTQRLCGEPFWSSTEIVVNSQLSVRTTEFLADHLSP